MSQQQDAAALVVTTPWAARRDPAAQRRLLCARLVVAQRAHSLRARQPLIQRERPRVDGVEPEHAHDDHAALSQHRDGANNSGRSHRPGHEGSVSGHHDFVGRFRER